MNKKEKEYLRLQGKWVSDNNIKPGSQVKVLREAKDYEKGWSNIWLYEMDSYVGGKYIVEYINDLGISLKGGCFFPYFVLHPAFKLKRITHKKIELNKNTIHDRQL